MVLNLVIEDVVIAATSTLLTTSSFEDNTYTSTITKTITSTYTSYQITSTSFIAAVTTNSYGLFGDLTKRENAKFDSKIIAAIVLPITLTFLIGIGMILNCYFKHLKKIDTIEEIEKKDKIDEKSLEATNSSFTNSINSGESNYNYKNKNNNSNIFNYITKQPPETPLAIGLPFPSSATSFSTFNYDALSQDHNDNAISSPKIGKVVQPRFYPKVLKLASSKEIDKKKTTAFVNKNLA